MTAQDEAKHMVKRRDQALLMWQDEPNGYRFEAAEDATSRLVDALAAAIEVDRKHQLDVRHRAVVEAERDAALLELHNRLSALREEQTHA